MDTTEQNEPSDDGEFKSPPDDSIEAQRAVIRSSLNAIAYDVGMLMRDLGFNFPIYLCLPNSGDAILTCATPDDASDEDWSHAVALVSQIVGKKLGGISLCNRPVTCAAANANMSVSEVTADVGEDP